MAAARKQSATISARLMDSLISFSVNARPVDLALAAGLPRAKHIRLCAGASSQDGYRWSVACRQLHGIAVAAYARVGWGHPFARVSLMRCMACGEEMALTAVMPDDALTATGFEQQIFTCLSCHATEIRLVYARRRDSVSAPASSAGPQAAPACAIPAPAGPGAAPAGAEAAPDPCGPGSHRPSPPKREPKSITPAAAWVRAVEKLRSRQAELIRSAPCPEREHWTVQFTKDWERLAPARRRLSDTSPERPSAVASNSARALRARLHKLTSGADSSRTRLPAQGSSDEAVKKFNQLWESLVPPRNHPQPATEQPVQAAGPEPLPPSLSLVPIESVQSIQGQAISMLRGMQS